MKKSISLTIRVVSVVFVLFLLSNYGYTLGELSAKEQSNRVLLNLACSLDEKKFTTTLHSLRKPEMFEQMVGKNADNAWDIYKEELIKTCYQ